MYATILARYADACPDCPDRNVVVPHRLRTAGHGRGVVADYRCDRQHPWFTGWAWWDGVPHPTDDTPTLKEKFMKTVEIKGVWVRKATEHNGGRLEVLAELPDGTFCEVFAQDAIHDHDGPISHFTHPAGIVSRPVREFEPNRAVA